MKAIEIRPITDEELQALSDLYQQTKDVRIRTRAQMMLLAIEDQMTAPQIARIVRQNDQTIRRWIKRFNAEGINGLYDQPKSGPPCRCLKAIASGCWSSSGADRGLWINPIRCGAYNG